MNKQVIFYLSLAFACMAHFPGYSQTVLQTGNVAILGFNTTGSTISADNFTFILLADVEENTEIKFTDNGWKSNGTFRANEGVITWTAPTGGTLKSTVVSLYCDGTIISGPGTAVRTASTDFNFNTKGDQIIIYQNNSAPYNFVFALTNNDEWQSDATDSHTSALPTGLTDGVNAIAIPIVGEISNNAVYTGCNPGGITAGTPEEILAAVTSPDYWTGSTSSTVELPTCTFTISGLIIQYITSNKMKIDWADLEAGNEILIFCKEGSEFTTVVPSGDGSAYTANPDFSAGGTAFDDGKVVYKGTASDVDVSGLTPGNSYYFEAFSHATAGTTWSDVQLSSPQSALAKVQDVSDFAASNASPSNSAINLTWTSYAGPTSDWWNGGIMVVYRVGGAVSWVTSGSASSYSVAQDLGSGNFVAWKGTGNTAGFTSLTPNSTYHYKIFCNHGNYWSDGLTADATTTYNEILVEGNNVEILSGDNTPTTGDNTDFGSVIQNLTLTRNFKVKNTGNGLLALTGTPAVSLSGDASFSVSAQPAATVAANNGESSFTISFTPTSIGEKTATVSIANDDPNENPYTFSISGTGTTGLEFLPATGPIGTILTISGSGFSGGISSVTVGGTAASDVTVVSDTEIKARVASGTTDGIVTVNRTVGGAQSSSGSFTVLVHEGNCN